MSDNRKLTSIGYLWLAKEYHVDAIPHFVESFISEPGFRKTEIVKGLTREIYPSKAHKLETVFDHLDFALKREGLHLELLRAVLPRLSANDVTRYVFSKPTGANVRRIWYLYERFSGKRLPIGDMETGNYINLIDPTQYFTGEVRKLSRWRINLNLLHDVNFSPMLRRTPALHPSRDAQLHGQCADFVQEIPPDVFQRALRYFYARETRTSYEIERETPSQQRAEKFMALLAQAANDDFLTLEGLVDLQNAIVDPRYAAKGWRTIQNYVGQTVALGTEQIHLVPPKPEDLSDLMKGWLQLSSRLANSETLPAIASAAIVSWLFVYFHPFEDGNGRIHRFLIHHILARRQFGPEGVLLPVSAVLLNRPAEYEAALEIFSIPLKSRTDYELDDHGKMVVNNSTFDHFRYVDCTQMAEALYGFIEETILKELPAELRYLQNYNAARLAMRDIVEMPEPVANLFLKLCLQNNGRLSNTKRKLAAFEKLTEEEIGSLEKVVSAAYGLQA